MKALNLPILEQVIYVPKDQVEPMGEQLVEWGMQLKDCVPFQRAVIDGCLTALALHSNHLRSCMEAIVIHNIQIGLAYAKAEREVAELEKIR